MQKLRALQLADITQRIDQRVDIVAINRANVIKPEFFKQGARSDHAFGMLFGAARKFFDRRHNIQHFFTATTYAVIQFAGH